MVLIRTIVGVAKVQDVIVSDIWLGYAVTNKILVTIVVLGKEHQRCESCMRPEQ